MQLLKNRILRFLDELNRDINNAPSNGHSAGHDSSGLLPVHRDELWRGMEEVRALLERTPAESGNPGNTLLILLAMRELRIAALDLRRMFEVAKGRTDWRPIPLDLGGRE